ncbi:MAG TPA: adenylate/guanylate cyclase domain-containing protein [Actinomycetota bacterium]|nr:adenylate/guanylate cyclase domain-containing protein [Actinomycetota bacterium]
MSGRRRPVQPHGERKFVSILFADLTGYTKLSATLDPEEVYRFLRPGVLELQRIVEGFGGTVPQIMGDGFMAVFGVPVAGEDDAERAVRAGLAVRDHVRSLNAGRRGLRFPEVHAGVNSGEVMVAPSEEASGFAVIGDPVNTASRIADLAPSGVVLVDDETRRRTARSIRFGPRRIRRAKGKPRLAVHEALGIVPAPPGRREGPWTSPQFVDRVSAVTRVEAELADAVAAGRGRLLLVLGEPGAGKSRLAAELAARAQGRVVTGRCAPFGQRLPLQALAEALAPALGVSPGSPPQEARRQVQRFARSVGPGDRGRALAGGLRFLLGLGTEQGDPRERVVQSVRAARQTLETLAARGPTIVVLDDLQWADEDLLDFLRELRGSPLRGPVLVLGLSRSALRLPGVPRMELRAMEAQDMRTLVAQLLGPDVDEWALRSVVTRAEGNPLFLEESLGMLVEAGILVRADGRWRVADAERLRAVPTTIRLLIGGRIDGLPDEEKRVLQDAAVSGVVTWDRLIESVSEVRNPQAAIRSLQRRGLVRRRPDSRIPGASELEIRHAMIRDVAYEQLPRAERSRRHLAIAEWLRAREGSGPRRPIATIAHHYERAWALSRSRAAAPALARHVPRRAVEYLLRWADQAIVYQARSAADLYERASRIAREADRQVPERLRARALIGLAECLVEMGRYEEAQEIVAEARAAADSSGDPRLRGRALLAAGRLASDLGKDLGRIAASRRLLRRALVLLSEEGDLRGQAWAHHRLSETWSWTDYRRELDELREAHRLFVRAGDRWGRSVVAQDLAFLLTTEGGAEFDRWYSEAWRLVNDEQDLRSRSGMLRTWGYVSFYRGERAEAIRAMREARPLAVEAGDPYVEADTLLIEAAAACSTSTPGEVEALVRHLLEIARRTRSTRLHALTLLVGARSALRAGKPKVSLDRLSTATAMLRERGVRLEMAEAHLAAAELRLERGRFEGVAPDARQAVAVATQNGWVLWQPLAPLLEGRAALGAERTRAAVRPLRDAVGRSSALRATGTMDLSSALLVQAHLLSGADAPSPEIGPTTDRDVTAIEHENDALRALAANDLTSAMGSFVAAEEHRAPMGQTVWLARTLGFQAALGRALRDRRSVNRVERRAESVLRSVGAPSRLATRILRPAISPEGSR